MSGFLGSFIPAFYAKIARQSVARTIGFLLILILIISAALSLKSVLMINPRLKLVQKWAEVNLEKISGKLPVIEIKDGALIQPKETYVLEMGSNFVFAVEPDQKKETTILEKYKNVVMLTGKQFVFKQTGEDSVSEERRHDLGKVKNWKIFPIEGGLAFSFENNQISITPVTVKKWLKVTAILIFPVFLLVLFGFYSFTKPLQVLFFSLTGLIANAVLKAEASYKQIFNICAYALVPSTTLAVILEVFQLRLPGFWFLFSAIYILYIFLGLQSAKTGKKAVGQDAA